MGGAQTLEKLLDSFVSACLEVFGANRTECILLHGSAKRGGSIAGYSDADLMVFLSDTCFSRAETLRDELAFRIQQRTGTLDWTAAGFAYHQAFFRNAKHFENWWTVPAGYLVLFGRLPEAAKATPERVRGHAHELLADLPNIIDQDVSAFADTPDSSLDRRLRLLGTRINPAIYALVAYDHADAVTIWSETRDQAIGRLEARYLDSPESGLARRFFEHVRILFGGEWDVEEARKAFRAGVSFLRWAEVTGRDIEAKAVDVVAG